MNNPVIILKFGSRCIALLMMIALWYSSCVTRPQMPRWASWNKHTSQFVWHGGSIQFPKGFNYSIRSNDDTFEGQFNSRDNAVEIVHDIGGYAGAWAQHKDAQVFKEKFAGRARIWIAIHYNPNSRGGKDPLIAITFPDSGCANFYAYSDSPQAIVTFEFLAASFKPGPVIEAASSSCYQRN